MKNFQHDKLKIIIYVLIFFWGWFLLPKMWVSATSGACSFHDGVNCSMGRQANDNVYCNDGWTDSMVEYDFMVSCPSDSSISSCELHDDYECKYINNNIKHLQEARDTAMQNIDESIQYYKNLINDIEKIVSKNPTLSGFRSSLDLFKDHLTLLYIQRGRLMGSYLEYLCHCKEFDDILENYSKPKDYQFLDNDVKRSILCTHGEIKNVHYDSNILKDDCVCDDGYIKNSNGECVSDPNFDPNDIICKKDYGPNSYYMGKMTEKNETMCGCIDGYIWRGKQCKNIKEKNETCQVNVFYFPSAPYLNSDARRMYGQKESGDCQCPNNYAWQNNMCVINKNIIQEEKSLAAKIDKTLSRRVSGNILLQVEKNGEGWYVNPDNQKKYYLGRPSDAFGIMKNLGLGIKHGELENYLNSKFPSRLSGKIMLDVEQNGEAYYVHPKDLKGYFLNRPSDAFKVMRELGLGITNGDIRKIDIGEIE